MTERGNGIRRILSLSLVMAAVAVCAAVFPAVGKKTAGTADKRGKETLLDNIKQPDKSLLGGNREVRIDSLPADDRNTRYETLSDEDFRIVSEELGVETAAMKAVVLIEAGKGMKGFWAPGVPVVNFDNSMYSRFRGKSKVRPDADARIPSGLTGYALREWTLLVKARKKDSDAANNGTFWGMFQIGGFNYAKCGCATVDEFVRLMSTSELEQLELFAAFITNTGMLDDLRKKNWAAFARKYNGASYARRGYHKRMAEAYRKFSSSSAEKKKK